MTTQTMPKPIRSLEELEKALADQKMHDFYIVYQGGVRSSKTIQKQGGFFDVFHDISGEWWNYTHEELIESNIGRALAAGNFYSQDY